LNKLEEGLSSFLRYSEIVRPLAKVLSCARKVSRISYNKIEKIINDDPYPVNRIQVEAVNFHKIYQRNIRLRKQDIII